MRRALASAALVLVAWPGVALAKWAVQGEGLASAGWTDNILSSPTLRQSDFFFELRPGVVFTVGQARAVQRAAYLFDTLLFAGHSEANSYTNRLEWAGYFLPSKTTDILVSASVAEGRLNTFNLTLGSGQQPLQAVAPGGTTFLSALLRESLQWDLTDKWRAIQSVAFNAYAPLDPRTTPTTIELDHHFIGERSWKKDAFGFDVRIDYAMFTEVRGPVAGPGGGVIGNGVVRAQQQQIISALAVKWRHDFGHFWNTQAELGVVVDTPASGRGGSIVQPVALAALRFLHPYTQAELLYTHTVQPNTIVGQTFALDNATLRGAVPFGQKSRVVLSGSGGYLHGRVLDFETGGTTSTVDVIVADATLTWSPRREFGAYLRYSYFNQMGHPEDFSPQPSISRMTAMLGVQGAWPGEAAAVVPNRQALRVDRTDEPGIAEPHSPPAR